MGLEHDIEYLRGQLADYERKSRNMKWLLRQLWKKAEEFPAKLPKKLARAMNKRRGRTELAIALPPPPQHHVAAPEKASVFFIMNPERGTELARAVEGNYLTAKALNDMSAFHQSDLMHEQVRLAAAISPEIGSLNDVHANYLPPWHDGDYLTYRRARQRIPQGPWDNIVLVPFGKLGGADFVSGVLADALCRQGRTLILRTDLPDWDRPDWYPDDAPSIDISAELTALPNPTRALYFLLRDIGARHIFNVNSRLTFEMFVEYGARLAHTSKLHAYYFCADRDQQGNDSGYPVWYFAPLVPFLTTAICDSADLAGKLQQRFALPPELTAKVKTIYTPARTAVMDDPVVGAQIESQQQRKQPRILWAGRLDRQKRFDILVAVAQAMPDIQFDCWGKAVLDAPPKMSGLPSNLHLHGPFNEFGDLPLAECDGWLYTSEWDGLPTTLIELGAMGMPIVASAVGGVPELIDPTTGWPVDPADGVKGYVTALRDLLNDSQTRRKRALALRSRVAERHGFTTFSTQLADMT